MAVIYVYNASTNRIERYDRALSQPMPYNTGGTLTVDEFRGASCSNVLWTDRATMTAWNTTRARFGAPIPVQYAFRRIWEGGHSGQSQHYPGLALDMGQRLTTSERNRLWNTANAAGVWSYVEPQSLTPTWVHVDRRWSPPACPTGGYPTVRYGSRGPYVFVLQDALNAMGFTGGGLDGVFGNGTLAAARRFQTAYGLAVDGIVGCNTWRAIVASAVGMGQTATVVERCTTGPTRTGAVID